MTQSERPDTMWFPAGNYAKNWKNFRYQCIGMYMDVSEPSSEV